MHGHTHPVVDTYNLTYDTGERNGLGTDVSISLGDERTVVIDLDDTVRDELPAGIERDYIAHLQILGDLLLGHMFDHNKAVDRYSGDVVGLGIRIHGTADDDLHFGTGEIKGLPVEIEHRVG